ncbi:hypothetical protein NQ314_008252, partial [Rhamnusium bicolor]
MSQLSEHDKAILNCVFNPNLPLEEATLQPPEELQGKREDNPQAEEVKKLEIEAVQLAENGNLNEALNLINKAIEIAPKRPSLYNNRAHIYQFLRIFEEKHCARLTAKEAYFTERPTGSELARADFEVAAKLGNQFAKGQ